MLTDHHNRQGFMKNKPLQRRLGCWWETLSGYDLEIVYRTGKMNLADSLSGRSDYKAADEAEDRWKQAQETRAGELGEASAGESGKARTGKWEKTCASKLRDARTG